MSKIEDRYQLHPKLEDLCNFEVFYLQVRERLDPRCHGVCSNCGDALPNALLSLTHLTVFKTRFTRWTRFVVSYQQVGFVCPSHLEPIVLVAELSFQFLIRIVIRFLIRFRIYKI